MSAQTSMLHVRVDDELKKNATEVLANFGLTVSDAVRMLLTRIQNDGSLPIGLTVDEATYDEWFRRKVQESLDDPTRIPNERVMASIKNRRRS